MNGTTSQAEKPNRLIIGSSSIYFGSAEDFYGKWLIPTCIIVDGPYGVAGFPGDLRTCERLADWYRPHIERWT
jgi:hypothetical protein